MPTRKLSKEEQEQHLRELHQLKGLQLSQKKKEEEKIRKKLAEEISQELADKNHGD